MTEPRRYVLSNAALRDIEWLQASARQQIFAALDRYVAAGTGDVRKLTGRRGEWRLRIGDYRAIFERDVAEKAPGSPPGATGARDIRASRDRLSARR